MVVLHIQGFEQAEIAHRVGVSTRTIQKWLKAGAFPEARPRRKRRSLFDPYAPYVLKRWQEFRQILHCREGEKLDEWLEAVRACHIRELQSFVDGIERNKAAVLTGLTLPQNNGLVEGKVNKLKLIKRMGYGRAGFPLLRQRVLHAL